MSDTDPVVPSAENDTTAADNPTLSTTSLDAGVLYPESDAVRAALSGRPAGTTDEMPAGTDEVVAMVDQQAAEADPNYEPPVTGAAEHRAVEPGAEQAAPETESVP